MLVLASLAASRGASSDPTAPTARRVTVLTLDLGCGGTRAALSDAQRLERARAIIDAFPADLVFVARGGALMENLAAATHRRWIAPSGAGGAGVLTTWTPVAAPDGAAWSGLGAALRSDHGEQVVAMPLQFSFSPYQPYQLCGIAHDEQPFLNSAEAAAAGASSARGLAAERIAVAIRAAAAEGAVIAAGMVNEPSAADWSDAAVRAELCPMRVPWPSVSAIERAGVRDAWRAVHPAVAEAPGVTWPAIAMPRDRADRIDYIFAGAGLQCRSVEVLGEVSKERAGLQRPLPGGLPGEHRALYASLEWSTKR